MLEVYLVRLGEIEKEFGPESVQSAVMWRLLSDLELQSSCVEDSRRSLERAIAIRERAGRTSDQAYASDLEALGVLEFDTDQKELSLKYLSKAVSIYLALPEPPVTSCIRCTRGIVSNLLQMNNPAEAMKLIERQLVVFARLNDPGMEYSDMLNQVAQHFVRQGKYEQALVAYKRVLDLRLKQHSPDGEVVALAKANVAYTLLRLRRLKEAEKISNELYRWSQKQSRSARIEIGKLHSSVLFALGRAEEAKQVSKQVGKEVQEITRNSSDSK